MSATLAIAAPRTRGHSGISLILFVCLFAAQSGLIALSPVLAEVADDLGVSTATAGQLRTLSGLAAGTAALLLAFTRSARRFALRELLLGGAAILALGSVGSAVAPGFVALLLAQVLIGVAVALLVTAGTTAAAEWAPPERRTHVLSWALIGMPAAWIVGMPLIGALGEVSWRSVWLALPLAAAVVAALAASAGPRSSDRQAPCGSLLSALADRATSRWLLGELLANSAWIGTLVYSGALFVESYGTSPTVTGVTLAAAAVAYVAGSLVFRRRVPHDVRRPLARLALVLGVLVALFGIARVGFLVSAALLSLAAFVAGGRTLVGSSFGLDVAPERRMAVMGARAAANQYGYFFGSAAGGIALAASGYAGLGIALGGLFAAAALPLSSVSLPARGSVIRLRWSTASSALLRWWTGLRPSGSAGESNGRSSPPCSSAQVARSPATG
jgi:predicted MFS family arabinose efflux permease